MPDWGIIVDVLSIVAIITISIVARKGYNLLLAEKDKRLEDMRVESNRWKNLYDALMKEINKGGSP